MNEWQEAQRARILRTEHGAGVHSGWPHPDCEACWAVQNDGEDGDIEIR